MEVIMNIELRGQYMERVRPNQVAAQKHIRPYMPLIRVQHRMRTAVT